MRCTLVWVKHCSCFMQIAKAFEHTGDRYQRREIKIKVPRAFIMLAVAQILGLLPRATYTQVIIYRHQVNLRDGVGSFP